MKERVDNEIAPIIAMDWLKNDRQKIKKKLIFKAFTTQNGLRQPLSKCEQVESLFASYIVAVYSLTENHPAVFGWKTSPIIQCLNYYSISRNRYLSYNQ